MPYVPYSTIARLVLHQDPGSRPDTENAGARTTGLKAADAVNVDFRLSEVRSFRMLNSLSGNALKDATPIFSSMDDDPRGGNGIARADILRRNLPGETREHKE